MRTWSEQDVRENVGVRDVVDSLTEVLGHESGGGAWNIDKTMATWPAEPTAGSAHALGAVDLASDLVLFKTWVNTPAGASALMTLFSASDGRTLGVAEAGAAGALRTAAISGIATRLLSDPGADELAVLGAGRQALRQVEGVSVVRELRRVRVWNRTRAAAEALAEQVRDELGLAAVVEPDVSAATAGCPIVTLITRAAEPFLHAEHLTPGAHLNAVGAILPANAEFAPDVLAASALTVVDSEPNARRGSRELRDFYGEDWSGVQTLGDVAVGKVTRPSRPRLTVFKGMGMGLSDLAVARVLVR